MTKAILLICLLTSFLSANAQYHWKGQSRYVQSEEYLILGGALPQGGPANAGNMFWASAGVGVDATSFDITLVADLKTGSSSQQVLVENKPYSGKNMEFRYEGMQAGLYLTNGVYNRFKIFAGVGAEMVKITDSGCNCHIPIPVALNLNGGMEYDHHFRGDLFLGMQAKYALSMYNPDGVALDGSSISLGCVIGLNNYAIVSGYQHHNHYRYHNRRC